MSKALSASLLLAVSVNLGACCRSNCEDYLRVIPQVSADSWPATTDTYRVEILVDEQKYECSGHFESEGNDVWTCSDGVEAHSRYGWKIPTFYIYQDRVDADIHVRIWLEDVLIFDEDEDILWQLFGDSAGDPYCSGDGCWAGIIRATISSIDGETG